MLYLREVGSTEPSPLFSELGESFQDQGEIREATPVAQWQEERRDSNKTLGWRP